MKWANCSDRWAYNELGAPDEAFCYKIPATKKGLLALSDAWFWTEFGIVGEDGKCDILCTADNFYAVAGPRICVEIAVGTDILSAKRIWRDYANSFIEFGEPSIKEGKRWLALAELYESV